MGLPTLHFIGIVSAEENALHNARFECLEYMIIECNYGGRVTDEWDRRTMRSIFTETVDFASAYDKAEIGLSAGKTRPEYAWSAAYKNPAATSVATILEQLGEFPASDNPEVFGLSENAEIAAANEATILLCKKTLKVRRSLLVLSCCCVSCVCCLLPVACAHMSWVLYFVSCVLASPFFWRVLNLRGCGCCCVCQSVPVPFAAVSFAKDLLLNKSIQPILLLSLLLSPSLPPSPALLRFPARFAPGVACRYDRVGATAVLVRRFG
jgi:hypothetical protein